MIVSPLVLILVKQALNKPRKTYAFDPFPSYSVLGQKRSFSEIPTKLMYCRFAALTSNFYCLAHIFKTLSSQKEPYSI